MLAAIGCHDGDVASLCRLCLCSPGVFPHPLSLSQSPVHSVEGCRVRTREDTHLLAFRIYIRSSMQEPNICSASESVGCERDACGQRGVRNAKYAVRTARHAQSKQGPSQRKTRRGNLAKMYLQYMTTALWSSTKGSVDPSRALSSTASALGRGARLKP